MRKFILALPLLLVSCGAIYTSPGIDKNSDAVTVVEVNIDTLSEANASSYRPRALPKVFSSVSPLPRPAAVSDIPGPVQDEPEFSSAPETIPPPQTTTESYRIGISDIILLATPAATSTEELAGLLAAQNRRQGYTVQDDGAIAVPDVGRISIANMTIEEAEAAVFNALVDRQIDPKFSLEIADFKSKLVSVGGAVNAPKLVPITLTPVTLEKALRLSGGVNSETDNKNAVIRISRDGQNYQIPVAEFRSTPSFQKLRLAAGDVVTVERDFREKRAKEYADERLKLIQARSQARSQALAEAESIASAKRAQTQEARENFLRKVELGAIKRDYVYRAGEVTSQGRFALPFETKATVADALYSEGGVDNNKGDLGQIYLLRMNKAGDHVHAYHIDGGNAINILLATKLELRPDDVVFVSEQRVTAWNRVISQLLPTLTVANTVTQ